MILFSLTLCVLFGFFAFVLTFTLPSFPQVPGGECLKAHSTESSWGDDGGSKSTRRGLLGGLALGGGMLVGDPSDSPALFEDMRKPGQCPRYEDVRSDSVLDFDLRKYMGVWYQVAYHDWTQVEICGCTRLNMTEMGTHIEDIFTTKCPANSALGPTYAVNMSMRIDHSTPGRFQETAFYTLWPNSVLHVWKGGVDEPYQRAIQMQCVETARRRAFVGINFLSRLPVISSVEMNEMYSMASSLGLEPYGGSQAEMVQVDHLNGDCKYPMTTDKAAILERRGFTNSFLFPLGVRTIDQSLLVSHVDRSGDTGGNSLM
ncbi:unnamed protein product [Chrysoparadoxa australica]